MPNNPQHTAILFFTRSAHAESRAKRFVSSGRPTINRAVADALIGHTEKILHQTGLPVFKIDERMQRGDSFGQRFTHAFEDIFALGFENVISVGNDSPQLSADRLREAARMLEQATEVVLGPARDGGTWLMGYRNNAFDPDSFRRLPWKTGDLCGAAIHALPPSITPALLNPLDDLDDERDLRSFLESHEKSVRSLIRQIRGLLGPSYDSPINIILPDKQKHAAPHALRAPPVTA